MPLIGATLLLAIFAVNLGLGSKLNAAFLNDIGEMLLLISVAVLFVIVILKKEADAKKLAQHALVQGGHYIDQK